MRVPLLMLAAAFFMSSPASASPFKEPISEHQLETMRGGFMLPGGLDVSLAVTTESRIDNQLVLKSVFVLGRSGTSLDLQSRGSSGLISSLNFETDQSSTGADGTVTLLRQANSSRLVLDGQQTDVTLLVGGAFGSLVSNTADNRTIDVMTTVDIDISNASPELLGSSLLRAEDLALSSTAQLVR